MSFASIPITAQESALQSASQLSQNSGITWDTLTAADRVALELEEQQSRARDLTTLNSRLILQSQHLRNGVIADAEDPDAEALVAHAESLLDAGDAALTALMKKYSTELLASHFIVVAFAGAELRDVIVGIGESEQFKMILHAYLRWCKIYEEKVPVFSHDPNMFKRPLDFPKDLWELALLIPGKVPISGMSVHRKFKEDVLKSAVGLYGRAWSRTPPVGSGQTKWDHLVAFKAKLQADNVETKPKPSYKTWWAWITCGPPGLDFSIYRPCRPNSGPPTAGPNQLARRAGDAWCALTGELVEPAHVGRKQMRRQMNPHPQGPPLPSAAQREIEQGREQRRNIQFQLQLRERQIALLGDPDVATSVDESVAK
ncbi:hypothetical protein B484DRAFT_444085, partial [Ochromonadaceae sp. CCMP2298]